MSNTVDVIGKIRMDADCFSYRLGILSRNLHPRPPSPQQSPSLLQPDPWQPERDHTALENYEHILKCEC